MLSLIVITIFLSISKAIPGEETRCRVESAIHEIWRQGAVLAG
jgi:hypothetical protein